MRQLIRMPWIDGCVKNVLDWLYAPRCVLCTTAIESPFPLCAECRDDLPRLSRQCPRCGRAYQGIGICGQCQYKSPAFDLAIAPFHYGSPLNRLIHQFKYQNQLHYAGVLGELLRQEVEARLVDFPDVIIPVPLHRLRLRQRGFNQSLELARPIAQALDIPLDFRSVIRIRNTSPQAELPIKKRRQNVFAAFEMRHAMPHRSIAIVDDVMTSGHTVNQLAQRLKCGGAERVQLWVLART